jgi:phytoene/squalene synthetase
MKQAQQGQASAALRQSLQTQVETAVTLMQQGAPLARRLPGRVGWELRAVVQGGLQIARKIQAGGCDTLAQRPRLNKADVLAILWRTIWPQ